MFASNALPLPTSFGHEHRPLRLTAESARPQPQGGCHYQSSTTPEDRCSCQSFEHDRRAPGNICDCGHSACYHSATQNTGRPSPDRVIAALVEKIKKLEDCIIKEREARRDELSRERQQWEREARVLREALSPLYHNEQDTRRRLADLDDKIEINYEEHTRLRDRVVAIDDANMTLDRRIQLWEDTRRRKRKASLGVEANGVMSPESNYTSASSTESDATSMSTDISPQPLSPMNPPLPVSMVTASPRSSGLLNHRTASRHSCSHPLERVQRPLQVAGANHEPRSSGFLSIDLAERLRKNQSTQVEAKDRLLPLGNELTRSRMCSPSTISSGLPTPPQGKISTGALPVSGLLSADPSRSEFDLRSPKKRKQHNESTALDVLANASIASPLAQ